MAIDLQIFKEPSTGQQLQPTRTNVYTNPDTTTGLEGITSMFKEQERLVELQNDSNYAIQETKYLSERQKTLNEIGEQVASGQLTDIQAKEKVFKYDTEQENAYKTILPPTYHTRLNQRVQTEIAKTGASIDSLYKQTKDREFVANAGVTLSRAKDLTPEEATRQAVTILNDPRIPLDKKVEMADKFRNEYSTNRLNRQISANEKNNTELQTIYEQLSTTTPTTTKDVQTGVETITPKREDVSIDSYQNLTPEERTRYRADIQNQIERNNAEAKRAKEAAEKAQEVAQKEADSLVTNYLEQISTGIPPAEELTNQAKASMTPEAFASSQKQYTEAVNYRLSSTEVRQKMRNDLARQVEAGGFKTDEQRDLAIKMLSSYDKMDSEMDKREAEAPVETHLERNPGIKLDPNNKQSTALALAANNSKIIPYTSKELATLKTHWNASTESKVAVLVQFQANTALLSEDQKLKAVHDQVAAMGVSGEAVLDYSVAVSVMKVPAPAFDDEGNVTGVQEGSSLGVSIVRGFNSKYLIGDLTKTLQGEEYRNIGIKTPSDRRLVAAIYSDMMSRENKPIPRDSDDKVIHDPVVLQRAIKTLYGEELPSSGGWFSRRSYTPEKINGADTTVRLPLGMSQNTGRQIVEHYISNYSEHSGIPISRLRNSTLTKVTNRDTNGASEGVYVLTENGRPYIYGYTNKAGSGLVPKPTATHNIVVPFTINLNKYQKQ